MRLIPNTPILQHPISLVRLRSRNLRAPRIWDLLTRLETEFFNTLLWLALIELLLNLVYLLFPLEPVYLLLALELV